MLHARYNFAYKLQHTHKSSAPGAVIDNNIWGNAYCRQQIKEVKAASDEDRVHAFWPHDAPFAPI